MECKGKGKRMKEEAPSKKLPPKMCGGGDSGTPTKAAHDEILSSLLRINNFDSISSIKDESLDIDLSACVTISSASLINGNSLSSTDFWRVLDESAQNNTEINLPPDLSANGPGPVGQGPSPNSSSSSDNHNSNSEFNVTFLRPEPPNAFTNSPFKKATSTGATTTTTTIKLPSPEQMMHRSKPKLPAATSVRLKVFKEEPPEIVTKVEISDSVSDFMPPAFTIFQSQSQTSSMPPPPSVGSSGLESVDSPPPPPVYKCLDCNGLILDNADVDVVKHESAGHRVRISYKCNECQREFDLLAGLKKHLKTHRSGEGRKDTWKKCPDCGKCLKLGSMWMHRKIHSDNKKYQCDICGQKFVQKINLTHHARIHSSEKPYECPECQKRFQERSHLQRHQKYHAQTRSYRCEKCGKMYKTERCLKVHNLVHLEQRPFACNVCDKSFISNSKLKQHSNIHTGMRPFKCNYCPRDFTNFPNWLKHTRRRHKVDHKTGEHLENIPSYCSKKSTTTKAQKAAAAAAAAAASAAATAAATTTATTSDPTAGEEVKPPSDQPPVKQPRKKKQPQQQTTLEALGITLPAGTALQQVHLPQQQKQQQELTTVLVPLAPPPPPPKQQQQAKVKRERKQLAPKQLQQKPPPSQNQLLHVAEPPLTVMPQIKKEPISQTHGPFLDLQGLSLTSAEDLIMEQALEMEECGLYDSPGVSTDMANSDNAISSETAAALHFQIKNELPDEVLLPDEEFLPCKNGDRLACPSLESSPFSSPASIELAAVSSSSTSTIASGSTTTHLRSGNYYLPAFTLNAQGKLSSCTTSSMSQTVTANACTPTTVSVVNVPLMVRSNQMLPSVDTILFTTQTGGNRFFSAKSAATATATPHLT
ncbi:serendipity locus protein H-1 [Drosophila tropicalis]|uniref:serendipity locus protein H-1 n=1 Tax=Drosophila tropicalis TaxID=46794 RepID=UPI0035AB9D99